MAMQIVSENRFLDPGQLKFRKTEDPLDCAGDRLGLIVVHHQFHLGTNYTPCFADNINVIVQCPCADLDLAVNPLWTERSSSPESFFGSMIP